MTFVVHGPESSVTRAIAKALGADVEPMVAVKLSDLRWLESFAAEAASIRETIPDRNHRNSLDDHPAGAYRAAARLFAMCGAQP